jgi:hypothetical protein
MPIPPCNENKAPALAFFADGKAVDSTPVSPTSVTVPSKEISDYEHALAS